MPPASKTPPPGSVIVVLGTRPEIIKLGHLIRILGPAASIIHTGQHYDAALSATFFDAFDLPGPAAFLGVGGESRGAQIGTAVAALDRQLADTAPAAIVVQGDTNSALAGGLAANAREVPLIHVESGLRSFDRRMPEEHNRVLVDHIADACLAPTEVNRENLLAEGIAPERITVTGNTVVEAVGSLLPDAAGRARLLEEHGLEPNGFVISTFHRPENVDDPDRLRTILEQLGEIDLPVLLPMHPRTVQRCRAAGLETLLDHIRVIEPVGYPEFLGLTAEAALAVADSGGIQEEASVLKRPVLVVRRSTERPEVLGTFAERVEPGPAIAATVAGWLDDLSALHAKLEDLPSPYGDGSASAQSAEVVLGLAGAALS